MTTDIIILAAGQGSRMKSNLPKVLHPIGGKPMVQHVIDRASALQGANMHLVIGHGADFSARSAGWPSTHLCCAS